jgi:hypothetical protein
LHGRRDVAGERHQEFRVLPPQQEIREHPALGRAIGAVGGEVRPDARHVATQLSLEEILCVLAAELQHAKMIKRRKDAPRARRDEIGALLVFARCKGRWQAHVEVDRLPEN